LSLTGDWPPLPDGGITGSRPLIEINADRTEQSNPRPVRNP
jgi:hypothetical protein